MVFLGHLFSTSLYGITFGRLNTISINLYTENNVKSQHGVIIAMEDGIKLHVEGVNLELTTESKNYSRGKTAFYITASKSEYIYFEYRGRRYAFILAGPSRAPSLVEITSKEFDLYQVRHIGRRKKDVLSIHVDSGDLEPRGRWVESADVDLERVFRLEIL